MQNIKNTEEKNIINPCSICTGCSGCETSCCKNSNVYCGKCCQNEIIYDLYDSEVVATFDPKDL